MYPTEDLLHMPTVGDGGGTVRGHQIAMAFLSLAAGLEPTEGSFGGGPATSPPPPYMHFDIAGSTLEYPAPPSAAPLLALLTAFADGSPALVPKCKL